MTQRSAAEALDVSYVHLSNVERGKAEPSSRLLERFKEVFRDDLHVLNWCLCEDDELLPEPLRVHRQQLGRAWRQVLAASTPECPDTEGLGAG